MSANRNARSSDKPDGMTPLRDWNSKKFIELSDNLGDAYCPGSNNSKSKPKADFWTVDKFISMSRYLSSAYGVDF